MSLFIVMLESGEELVINCDVVEFEAEEGVLRGISRKATIKGGRPEFTAYIPNAIGHYMIGE